MNKVLLVNTSFRENKASHYSSFGPPMGLLAIAASLKAHGYFVELVDPQIDDDYTRRLNAVLAEKPLFVGVSTYLGENVKHAREIARVVKQANVEIPIVLGGPMASSIPEVFFREMPVDFIVMGSGEETVVKLADAFSGSCDPRSVPCVSYKQADKLVVGEMYGFNGELDDLPAPDLKIWEKGIRKMGRIPIITSRGCPRGCAFCYNTFTGKKKYFLRSTANVIAEMEKWATEFGLKSFEFFDDNFLLDPRRALAIIEEIRRRKWNVGRLFGHLNEFNHVTPAQLAGVVTWVVMCVESGSPKIQKLLNKPIDIEKALDLVARVAEQEMGFLTAFMFGLPGETDEDIRMSIELASKIRDISASNTSMCYIYAPQPNDAIVRGLAESQHIDFSLDAIANVEVVPVPPDNKLELRLRPWISPMDRVFYLDLVQVWQHHFGERNAPACDLQNIYGTNTRIRELFKDIPIPDRPCNRLSPNGLRHKMKACAKRLLNFLWKGASGKPDITQDLIER